MRICLSFGLLETGGIGKMALHFAEAFIRQGHEVDMFLTHLQGTAREAQIPKQANVFLGKGHARNSLLSVIRYFKQRKPDMVISAHDRINVLMALGRFLARSRKDSKLIFTYRTHRSLELTQKNLRIHIHDSIGRLFRNWSDASVAVSQGVAKDLTITFRLKPSSIHVIYNPAWTESNEKELTHTVHHPWFRADRNYKILVTAGRLTQQKDYPTLIKALQILRTKMNVKLLIIGVGEKEKALKKLVHQLDLSEYVDFLGFVPNPVSYFVHCDCFALSSAWEGFGNVLVEALGAGLSIVSTNCPSGPAEILDHGKYGKLVPVGNYEALAQQLEETLMHPFNAEKQKERAKDFSDTKSANLYLDLYKQLLAKQP